MNFFEFKIDLFELNNILFCTGDTQHVEHPVARLIAIIDRHLRQGVHFANLFVVELF